MGIKDNLGFAGAIVLAVGIIVAVVAGIVYGVVTVAKWAWGG